MKKNKLGLFLQLTMIISLTLGLTLPVKAESQVEILFYEDLREGEHLWKEVENPDADSTRRGHLNDDGKRYVNVDLTHVTRPMHGSVLVADDVTLIDVVRIEIPEGRTMTIAKGATVVIHGQLAVYGKLINKGTIIIGDKWAYKETDRLGEISIIENHGEVINQGTIELARGEFHNEAYGNLENNGTIDITNHHKGLSGLLNGTLTNRTLTIGGSIVNNGVIHVNNNGGYGIRIPKQTSFENNGTVTISESGLINGSITGNRPVRATGGEE